MLKEEIQNTITRAMKDGNGLVCATLRMLLSVVILKEKEKRYKILKSRFNRGSPDKIEAPRLCRDSTESGQKSDLNEEGLIKEFQLTDEEIIEIIFSEIKKRKDAVVLYEKGNRRELADKEKKEIEVLQKYLPAQMTEEEVKKLVQETIQKIEANSIKDMGRVMAELMPKVKGKADNSLVSKIVKESLFKKY